MTYSEMIKELHRRSGLLVKEYAAAIGYSTTQFSNIVNDSQPGSLKALLACLRHAQIDIQDCLDLPDSQPIGVDERRAARAFKNLSPDRRKVALQVLEAMLPSRRRK